MTGQGRLGTDQTGPKVARCLVVWMGRYLGTAAGT